jgi:hypothetical protein
MRLSSTVRLFFRSRPFLTVFMMVAAIAATATVTGALIVLDELNNGSLPYV